MLQTVKKLFKKSLVVKRTVAFCLYSYLKFVYATTRWTYVYSSNESRRIWSEMGSVVAVCWHDKLAILPKSILHKKQNMHILVSPHSDGIIISSILRMFGFNIISGSTNKNPTFAVREIMRILKSGDNIAITPDGPRGPRYKVNSNIIPIAQKCGASIAPVSCVASNCFLLRSWDKLIFPLPFGRIKVYIGEVIAADQKIDEIDLEKSLKDLAGD